MDASSMWKFLKKALEEEVAEAAVNAETSIKTVALAEADIKRNSTLVVLEAAVDMTAAKEGVLTIILTTNQENLVDLLADQILDQNQHTDQKVTNLVGLDVDQDPKAALLIF